MEELLKLIGLANKDKKEFVETTAKGPYADSEKYESYLMSPWFNDEERKKLLRQRGEIR